MRYFWMSLGLGLRRQLRRPGVYLLVLASLLASLAFRWTAPPEAGSQAVRVGVSLPEEGGEALWTALEARENGAVRFIRASEDHVRAQVAASRWDCGLIFPEDFALRLEEGDLEKSVTLITGPGSAAYPLVRETASAVLAAMASPGIAAAYLEEQGLASVPSGGPVPPVEIALETLDGAPLTQQSLSAAGRDNLLLGVLAAGALVWTLFAAMDLGRWGESPQARRARSCLGLAPMLLPRLLASLLPAWCAAALALGVALDQRALPGLGMLGPYFCFLGALALVLASLGRAWTWQPALIPCAATASLVLSPWLVDVPSLFPALAPVCRYLPVTLYLSGCGGDARAGWTLGAMAAALLAAAAAKR